jgi:hypothetical protein
MGEGKVSAAVRDADESGLRVRERIDPNGGDKPEFGKIDA